MSESLYEQALAAFRSGDDHRARERSEELLRGAQGVGDAEGEVGGLCMLARVALREGDVARMTQLATEARERARGLGDPATERMPLHL